MPPENEKVKRAGRIEYIEPNSLFGNSVNNGVPQPYENYSISVNLRVKNGDRYDCGLPGDDFLEFSSDKGTVSFMDGTSDGENGGYLTTNFTDISMNDPSTNTSECLGIEYISIRYDSWYYPTVEIKFIDVRGASLMQPAEYEYYNNGGPNEKNTKQIISSNHDFFRAFFSFPYPLFQLSVKGFYGKEVTYDLSVLKCNIEFNSSTGNFEMNVSFIGYMYGMYADLPFTFAYLAPYIDLYGKNTWEEKKNNGDFCYIETNDTSKEYLRGIGMYTFPELKRIVDDVNAEFDKIISEAKDKDGYGLKKKEYEKLIETLNQNVYFNYPTKKKDEYKWSAWSKVNTEENRKGYFYLVIDNTDNANRDIFDLFYKFSYELNEYNKIASDTKEIKKRQVGTKDVFSNIFNKAEEIKKTKANPNTSTVFSNDDIKKILSGNIVNLVFHLNTNNEKPTLTFDREKSDKYSNNPGFDTLVDEFLSRFEKDDVKCPISKNSSKKEWNIKAFYIDNILYEKEIAETVNEMKKELSEILKKIEETRKERIQDAIKFKPTIRNLYNMIFAHVDTFMSVYYTCLETIRKQIEDKEDDKRKFKKLCGSNIKVDVSDTTLAKQEGPNGNGGKLPPFTMFYKEETVKDSEDKKITMVWPGELTGGKDLEEVKLVESILRATLLNKKSYEDVQPSNNVILRKGDLVPTNYYDIIRKQGNPYLDVLNDKSLSFNDVAKVFMLRCFYSLLNGSYVAPENSSEKNESSTSTSNFTKKAKLIAELEIGNVIRAFQILKMSPNDTFFDELNKVSDDGSAFISKYLSGNNPVFASNGAGANLIYRWIERTDENSQVQYRFYPVGTFSTSVLENYVSKAEKYLKENVDKFIVFGANGRPLNSSSAHLYAGGKYIESVLGKNSTGEFVNASRLFPNYKSVPTNISGVTFYKDTTQSIQNSVENFKNVSFIKNLAKQTADTKKADNLTISKLYSTFDSKPDNEHLPSIPSGRKTSAGYTSVFMDPLYYAQKTQEAKAYFFLMGIPYGEDKKFFIPTTIENGDYPTLMLLREGAVYWRNDYIKKHSFNGTNTEKIDGDPISYEYKVNGITYNELSDIEANDPCFGVKYAIEPSEKLPTNVSEARRQILIDYFLKWVNGTQKERSASVTASTYVHIDVPSPCITFQEIERWLGLWESVRVGLDTLSRPLDVYSCSSASTAPYVSSFSNENILRSVYIIGSDGKLGNVTGKIRNGVFLNFNAENQSQNVQDFFDKFLKFYFGFDTIIDYATFDNDSTTVTGITGLRENTVPRNAMNDAMSAFITGIKDYYGVSKEKLKDTKGIDSTGKPEDSYKKPEPFSDNNLKLACYIALKNMYDKWLCSMRRERWYFSIKPEKGKNNGITSDFSRFYYIDEFFHDIGMEKLPNLSRFTETTNKLGGFTSESSPDNMASVSIMKILSMTGEYAGCSVLTLPTMLGLARTKDDTFKNSILDVFTAFPYNDMASRGDGIETSFIVLYSNQKSSFLDNERQDGKQAYKTDGFDIANTWGEIVENPMFSDGGQNSFVVPAFGVTFAKQNQSYFKDIRLSMADHNVTEYSLRNEIMISYMGNSGPNETTLIGQDLYSVFSNYSYSCTVTMMGDAQITPLMYFQLNNIAMWKGAYLITNVHHEISSRGMETIFTGVRQARPTLPSKDDNPIFTGDPITKTDVQSQEETTVSEEPIVQTFQSRPLDEIDVERVRFIVFVINRMSLKNRSDGYNFIDGVLSANVYYDDSNEPKIYDYIANTLEPYTALKGKIENYTPEENESYFAIPSGRYSKISVENIPVNKEYRDANDTFYAFTQGKHILITDNKLLKVGDNSQIVRASCEMITGATSLEGIDGGGLETISYGGASPILLQADDPKDINKQFDKDEIRSTYREVFDLVKRMNEAKKPISLLIKETDGLPTKEIKK